MKSFEIIGWSEIQEVMTVEGFEVNSALITQNDDLGIGSLKMVNN